MKYNKIVLLGLITVFFLAGCDGDSYTPKPRAYYRIALPEKQYQVFDSVGYPYTFDYPVYATIEPYYEKGENYWINITFPQFNGEINLSYRPVKNNLNEYIADANKFVSKHMAKSTGIREKEYSYPEEKVFGMAFDIRGSGVASTYQFYLTDSAKHYVRGALYFNVVPNNDSLAPVIDFVKADIDHLIATFKWKK